MRGLILIVCLVFVTPALAQQQTEIIALRHRTVEEVLPVLQPLVETGGALTGMSGQLIIRTSPQNLSQIRQALAAIDRPARNLVIHVTQDRDVTVQNQGIALSSNIKIGDNVRVTTPAETMPGSAGVEIRHGDARVMAQGMDTQGRHESRADQSVRVMDGGRAFIRIGRSLAVPLRRITRKQGVITVTDSVVYRDIGQGFYAIPRVVGDRVTVEISPQFDNLDASGRGSVETQDLTTTVSGRIGEWLELGGSVQQTTESQGRSLGAASGQMHDSRSIWLRVDEPR